MNHIEEFIKELRVHKGYSEFTIKAYASDLQRFSLYLEKQRRKFIPNRITPQQIRGYVQYLSKNGKSQKTKSRHLQSLRTYYKFLLIQGYVDTSPMDVIQPIQLKKADMKIPKVLTPTQVEMLLDNKYYNTDYEGLMDCFMITLFYYTGMRLSELINLDINNYQPEELKVTGKGNKQRIIPYPNIGQLAIDYLDQRNKIETEHKNLFVVKKGTPLYTSYIHRVLKHHLKRVGVKERLGPHILRHTLASDLINNNVETIAIKELLGHETIGTTEIYTKLKMDTIIEQHKLLGR